MGELVALLDALAMWRPVLGDDGLNPLASARSVASGLLLFPRISNCFTKHFGGI